MSENENENQEQGEEAAENAKPVDPEVEKELAGIPEQFLDAGDDEEESAAEALALLQSEVDEAKQQVLYARAETQNVRRRLEKEKEEARAYASTGFARDVLSVATICHALSKRYPLNCAKMTS